MLPLMLLINSLRIRSPLCAFPLVSCSGWKRKKKLPEIEWHRLFVCGPLLKWVIKDQLFDLNVRTEIKVITHRIQQNEEQFSSSLQ